MAIGRGGYEGVRVDGYEDGWGDGEMGRWGVLNFENFEF
jgi:hypothetical protein